ncbi:hypothetical protein E8E14_000570 [Neopestalotiopsis sp. 37M]|nr:hypothetical protein E8E14_000570 [Neopestalotiopsis sp. 37M]
MAQDPHPKGVYAEYEDLAKNTGVDVLLQRDAEFKSRQDSYWSRTAAVDIAPKCIVKPKSAQEVSGVLKWLRSRSEKFAVRSGGHMPWAGSNNMADGVTVDLSEMDWTRFNAAKETVEIGPGARWLQVYASLHQHHRVVVGGRDGNVGVAGLLLGGGISYFTARRGFGCDNVVAYEVVLADGRIVTADSEQHSDLFRALKGGGNNFGIVTSFRMKTLICEKAWGGITFYHKDVTPQAIKCLVNFTDRIETDPDSNLLCFFTYAKEFNDTVVCTVLGNVAGKISPAFDEWRALPILQTTCKTTTVLDMLTECSVAPQGYFNTFFTACFQNDARIVQKAVALHEDFVSDLKGFIPGGDFISQCLFQPLPLLFTRQSAEAGGNVLGLDRQQENGLILTVSVMVKKREEEEFAYPRIHGWVHALRDFAAEFGGNQEWLYANYADGSQDPLRSYGAENLDFLRAVAAKYDPDGAFQKECPGGFKLYRS